MEDEKDICWNSKSHKTKSSEYPESVWTILNKYKISVKKDKMQEDISTESTEDLEVKTKVRDEVVMKRTDFEILREYILRTT